MKYMVVREKKSNRMFGLYKRDNGKIYEDKITFKCLDTYSLSLNEAKAMLHDFILQEKSKRKEMLNNLKEKDTWLINYTKPKSFFLMKTTKIRTIL